MDADEYRSQPAADAELADDPVFDLGGRGVFRGSEISWAGWLGGRRPGWGSGLVEVETTDGAVRIVHLDPRGGEDLRFDRYLRDRFGLD